MSQVTRALQLAAGAIACLICISLAACTLLGGSGGGTLVIKLYPVGTNPDDQTADDDVSFLLAVTPAIAGQDLFASDASGTVTIKGIEPGTYELRPALAPDDLADTVSVTNRHSIHLDMEAPTFGAMYVVFNEKLSGALADIDFRRGLALAIDRDTIAAAIGLEGYAPATTFLPPTVTQTVLGEVLSEYSYSVSEAEALTGAFSGVSFRLETNAGNPVRETSLGWVNVYFEALSSITSVDSAAIDFDDLLTSITSDPPTFEAAIVGLAHDDNNMASVFEGIYVTETVPNISPEVVGLDAMIQAAIDAVAAGSLADYRAAIAAVSNTLIDGAPMVPIASLNTGW